MCSYYICTPYKETDVLIKQAFLKAVACYVLFSDTDVSQNPLKYPKPCYKRDLRQFQKTLIPGHN